MKQLSIVLLLSAGATAGVAQLFLKLAARKSHLRGIKIYANRLVVAGYGLLLGTTLATVIAFRHIEFKYGTTYTSVSFVVVVFLSRFVLKEQLTRKRIFGSLLVVVGIIVFGC